MLRYLFCLPLLLAAATTFAQGGKWHVAKYDGNRNAALSLTFDDGLKEHYTLVFPRLKEMGLKATFAVIGSRMDNPPKNPSKATFSWEEAREMAEDGQEITSHGWSHTNVTKLQGEALRYEVEHNDSAIYRHVGLFPRTYFYPGNRKDSVSVDFCSRHRVGTRTSQVSLGSKRDSLWMRRWIDQLVADGEWGVTMTHGITIGYDCFDNAGKFWYMLEMVKNCHDLWTATFHDIAAYTKERENVAYSVSSKGKRTVILLKSTLEKEIFHYPLTMVIEDDGSGKTPIAVIQDHRRLDVISENGFTYFRFNPNGGKITIRY